MLPIGILALLSAVIANAEETKYVQAVSLFKPEHGSFISLSRATYAGGLRLGSAKARRELEAVFRRQNNDECADPLQYRCTNIKGCCDPGYTCVEVDSLPACCPEGVKCDSVGGCPRDTIMCEASCCPAGSECVNGACAVSEPTDTGKPMNPTRTATGTVSTSTGLIEGLCPAGGYTKCPNFDACCPDGVKCIGSGKCDITCTPDDIVCGDGCCLKGFKCNSVGRFCYSEDIDLSKFSSVQTNSFAPKTTKVESGSDSTATEEVSASTSTPAANSGSSTVGVGFRGSSLLKYAGAIVGVAIGSVVFL